MARDPYLELGVSRTASAAEIRKAFHKLAKQHHPDANKGDKKSEEKFKQVSAAFDILGDADKRKKFDAGEIDADGRETMRGGFGGAGSPFGGGFKQPPQRGQDVRATLQIDIEDAVRGTRKRVSFSDGRTLDVTIPKGAHEGQVLRLKGQGAPGRGGAGDALIELKFALHPVFRREGDQLVMDLPVSFPDAVLGAKVEAPTPDGTVALTVPKGSNSGATLRLKGRGLPDARTGKRGDLLARVMIVMPEGPDAELEAIAERWRKEKPYAPKRKG